MDTSRIRASQHCRQRGSAYVMVLLTAMIATVVGLSGLYAIRIQHRSSELTGDGEAARFYAISAVDRGLLIIEQNPVPTDWRNLLANNGGFPILNDKIGRDLHSLQAVDPLDGDLNNGDHAVLLTGIGYVGEAVFKLQVQLDGSGKPVPGTWRRVVD